MTATPDKYPQKSFKIKGCRWCNTEFQPLAPSHLFCSDECKDRSFQNSYYMSTYGISIDEVEKLLDDNNHECMICKSKGFKMHESALFNLVIDHCHHNKNVRGVLCHNCNRGLGLFKDSIENLLSAISYLEGATTISKESTYKCTEAHSTHKE